MLLVDDKKGIHPVKPAPQMPNTVVGSFSAG